MATGKFMARSRLEIHLKRMRLFERLKGEVAVQHPWREFLGVKTSVAGIVVGKTTLQVGCRTDIPFGRIIDASKNVSIEHG